MLVAVAVGAGVAAIVADVANCVVWLAVICVKVSVCVARTVAGVAVSSCCGCHCCWGVMWFLVLLPV
jgi:hypothetical protein